MQWRVLSASIVLFWAVMMGLLIRDTYFPDHSRFAVVPPRYVFDLFLSEAAAFNNTLLLYHEQEKIGQTIFSIRKTDDTPEGTMYDILISGNVDLPVPEGKAVNATFRLTGDLMNAEEWRSLNLEVKAASVKLVVTIDWKLGDKLPAVEVKNGGQVVMNTEMIQMMMPMVGKTMGQSPLLAQLPALAAAGAGNQTALPLKAREGVMDLAGKRRRCYILSLNLMQGSEVRAFFTEVGELARIDLPQGYRFIEPMMHGLEPGMNTME